MTSISELIKYEDIGQVIQYNPFTNHTVAAMEKDDKIILQLFGTLLNCFKIKKIHAERLNKKPIIPAHITEINCVKCVEGLEGGKCVEDEPIYVGYGICWFRAFIEVLMSNHVEIDEKQASSDFSIIINLMKKAFSNKNCKLFEAKVNKKVNNKENFKFNFENYNLYLMYLLSEKSIKFRYKVSSNWKTLVAAICKEYIDSVHILIQPLKLFSHVYNPGDNVYVVTYFVTRDTPINRQEPILDRPTYIKTPVSEIATEYLLLTYTTNRERLEKPTFEVMLLSSLKTHRNNLVLYSTIGNELYELVAVVISNHLKSIRNGKVGHVLSIVRGEEEGIWGGVEVNDFNIYEQLFLRDGELSLNWNTDLNFNLNIGSRECIYKKVDKKSHDDVKNQISKFKDFEDLITRFDIFRRIPSYEPIFLNHLYMFVSGYGYKIKQDSGQDSEQDIEKDRNIFNVLNSISFEPLDDKVSDKIDSKYRETYFGIIKKLYTLIVKDDEIVEKYLDKIKFSKIWEKDFKEYKHLDYCIENLCLINKYKSLFYMLINSKDIKLKDNGLREFASIINTLKQMDIGLANIGITRFFINIDEYDLKVCFSFDYLIEVIYKKITKINDKLTPLEFIKQYFDVDILVIDIGIGELKLEIEANDSDSNSNKKILIGVYDPDPDKNERWVGYFRIRNNLFKGCELYESDQTTYDLLLNLKKSGELYCMYGKYENVIGTGEIITKIPDEFRTISKIIRTANLTTFTHIFTYLIRQNVCFEFFDEDDDSEKIETEDAFKKFLESKRLKNIYGFSFYFKEKPSTELKGMCEAIETYMGEIVSEYITKEGGGISGGGGSGRKNKKHSTIGIIYKNNTYKPYICKKKNKMYIIVDNIKKYPKYPFKLKKFKLNKNVR